MVSWEDSCLELCHFVSQMFFFAKYRLWHKNLALDPTRVAPDQEFLQGAAMDHAYA